MKRKTPKRKESVWPKLLLGIVTLLQLLASIALYVVNRQAVIKILKDTEETQVLYRAKRKTTKIEPQSDAAETEKA